MRRIATVVAALMLPMQVQALGVGDIESFSALNQPLEAEIGLFSVGSVNHNDILVKLAPFEAYEQAGIEFPSILSSLKFSVETRADGEFFIRLHSTEAVREPFLDLLVQVDWPSGHLMREYTVLLDLPVMTDEEVGPVSAPVSNVADETPLRSMVEGSGYAGSVKPDIASEDEQVVESVASSPEPLFGETVAQIGSGDLRVGMVKRGDTLWAIAESMRTDRSVSVQQIMMALLKNNPQAFYNNNINNLKAGYVLRLDNAMLVAEMSREEAARESQRQYQAWQAAKKGQSQATGQGAGGSGGAGSASLRLVTPDDTDSMLSNSAAGNTQPGNLTSENLDALRQELDFAMTASDGGRQENNQLRARIAELEEQIGKMQRLLSLRDDALSVLQATPGAAEDMAPDDGEITSVEAAMPADTATTAKQSADVSAKPAPVNKSVSQKPVSAEQGIVDTLLGYINRTVDTVTAVASPLILGSVFGGLLLLLGGSWFLRKRKISDDDLEQSMMVEVADKQLSEDLANGTVSDLTEPKEETSAVELLDSTDADKFEADIDEIDVLAEADVYLAYQRFDRAEELMREAVESEPKRLDLMLKLLEVLSISGDSDGFVEMAQRFADNGAQDDPVMWGKVREMADNVGVDHPLFGGGQAGEQSTADDLDLPGGDLDTDFGSLDDDLMASMDEDITAAEVNTDNVVETELDDLHVDGEQVDDTEISAALDDNELDFDPNEHADDDIGGLDADTLAEISGNESEQDNVLEFDVSSLTSDEDADASTETIDTTDTTEQDEDKGLTFESGAFTMDDTDNVDASQVEEKSVSKDDAGDDNALDFDLSGFDEDNKEDDFTAKPDDEDIDNDAMAFVSEEVESSNIDDELSDDIDWLTNAADGAVEEDNDNFFSSEDEVATKLDLIRAYIDMGDKDSARSILSEVVVEGNDDQQQEAQELLSQLD